MSKTLSDFIKHAKEVHGDIYDYSRVVYVNNHTKIEIGHPDGYWFWQIPKNHLKGHGDWQSRQQKIENTTKIRYGVAHPLQNTEIKSQTQITNLQRYGVSCTLLDPITQQKIRETNQARYGVNCVNQVVVSKETQKILDDPIKLSELLDHQDVIELAANLIIHPTTLYRYINKHEIRGIRDGWSSIPERVIFSWLSSLGFNFRKDRMILDKKEIDFFCEYKKFGIEYGSLFSHSEYSSGRDCHYHYNKYKKCLDKNINLITIFGDEWQNHRPIVENIIKTKLGIQEKGVGARHLDIHYINNRIAKQFLDANHIQGAASASVSLGAHRDRILVGVMIFGHPTRQSAHPVELKRFCTDGKIYPGLASRMFHKYILDYQPTSVVSFSDNRYFNGTVYPKIGFYYDGEVKPDFYYVENYKIRHNKSKFRKSRLNPSSESESSIMHDWGFDRIWDCGKKRFVWRNPKY